MIDLSFSELAIVGSVALVVLGPERLPMVAKTAGKWLGKAQRMVQQVKSDIERETELSELKKIQDEARGIADNLTKTVKGEAGLLEKEFNAISSDVNKAASEIESKADEVKASIEEKPEGAAAADESNSGTTSASAEFDQTEASDTSGAVQDGEQSEVQTVSSSDGQESEDGYDYSWDDDGEYAYSEPQGKIFTKRYKSGPSIDELAEQLERLKAEVGDRSPRFGGNNRRYVARARSNRVRIYR
jgi:sec-independent protein translocase protein TatB